MLGQMIDLEQLFKHWGLIPKMTVVNTGSQDETALELSHM